MPHHIQAIRDALAAEIRSWRRREAVLTRGREGVLLAYEECDALGMAGQSWAACENAARVLRGFASALTKARQP